jgi:hypothetical protein
MKNEEHDGVLGATYCTVKYVHSAPYNRLTNLKENLIPSSVFRALAAAAATPTLSLSLLSAVTSLPAACSAWHIIYPSL